MLDGSGGNVEVTFSEVVGEIVRVDVTVTAENGIETYETGFTIVRDAPTLLEDRTLMSCNAESMFISGTNLGLLNPDQVTVQLSHGFSAIVTATSSSGVEVQLSGGPKSCGGQLRGTVSVTGVELKDTNKVTIRTLVESPWLESYEEDAVKIIPRFVSADDPTYAYTVFGYFPDHPSRMEMEFKLSPQGEQPETMFGWLEPAVWRTNQVKFHVVGGPSQRGCIDARIRLKGCPWSEWARIGKVAGRGTVPKEATPTDSTAAARI